MIVGFGTAVFVRGLSFRGLRVRAEPGSFQRRAVFGNECCMRSGDPFSAAAGILGCGRTLFRLYGAGSGREPVRNALRRVPERSVSKGRCRPAIPKSTVFPERFRLRHGASCRVRTLFLRLQSRNPSRTSCSRIPAQSATGRLIPSTRRIGHPSPLSSI